MRMVLVLFFVAVLTPALAQQPAQTDQQLNADWQAMMTAVQHVQQSLLAKIKEDADKEAALQKQIDELKKPLIKNDH